MSSNNISQRIQWLRSYINNYHLKKETEKQEKKQRPIWSFFFSEESCLYRELLAELNNEPKYIASAKITNNIYIKKPQFVLDNYFYHPSVVSKKTYKHAIQLCDELEHIFIY